MLALTSRRTLLVETVARLRPLIAPARTWIVTTAAQAATVRRQVPLVRRDRVLAEPEGRNTAAAIALAALALERRAPDAVMAVLPADHAIGDAHAFRDALAVALDVAAATDALVTLGVEATHAETGYGYIQPAEPVSLHGERARWVARFVEKPSSARAAELVAAGDALWNTGIFTWRVAAILAALRRWLPDLMAGLERARGMGGAAALRRAYRRLPRISIDTGVLERAERVAVVRAGFPWSDVGSWAAVERLWGKPGQPNAIRGRVVSIDSRGCVVDASTRLVALLGVEDLVVVDTPDALLVCPKTRAQDVRLIVDELGRRRLSRLL